MALNNKLPVIKITEHLESLQLEESTTSVNDIESTKETVESTNKSRDDLHKRLFSLSFEEPHNYTTPFEKHLLKLEAGVQFTRKNPTGTVINLIQSHAKGLRRQFIYRQKEEKEIEWLSFDCHKTPEEEYSRLLGYLREMPKEWTLVQLTSAFNYKLETAPANPVPIYLTVMECGKDCMKPFAVRTKTPETNLTESVRQIIEKFHFTIKRDIPKNDLRVRQQILQDKINVESALKEVVQAMESKLVASLRCYLSGTPSNQTIENRIRATIGEAFEKHSQDVYSPMDVCVVQRLAFGAWTLSNLETKQVVEQAIKDEALRKDVRRAIFKLRDEGTLTKSVKRNPLILIVDDDLDMMPWEMMNVLRHHPVSRMPSFHLTYHLFKLHESSIENGLKAVKDWQCGKYVLNPGGDLKQSEKRMKCFLDYWMPEWEGTSGEPLARDQFQQLVENCEIFTYAGHGSGMQYVGYSKLEKMQVSCVALLFGCSSIGLKSPGPGLEPYSAYFEYLIAGSPCILGMLWDVTDYSTDFLSVSFLNAWIGNNNNKIPWSRVDVKTWGAEGKIRQMESKELEKKASAEPELLRALSRCKFGDLKNMLGCKRDPLSYVTNCSCIARGIPVRIHKV